MTPEQAGAVIGRLAGLVPDEEVARVLAEIDRLIAIRRVPVGVDITATHEPGGLSRIAVAVVNDIDEAHAIRQRHAQHVARLTVAWERATREAVEMARLSSPVDADGAPVVA